MCVLGQIAIGFVIEGNAGQPQLLHQPILMGAMRAVPRALWPAANSPQ
jgi:hypothetical protein